MNFVSDEKYVASDRNKTDFFDKNGNLTSNESEALAKVIRHESGQTKNYIRENAFGNDRGSLVDPSVLGLDLFDKKISGTYDEFPFKTVGNKAIVYYLEFLKKRQPSFLRMAEREKNV